MLSNGRLAKRVRHIKTTVAQVKPLVKALRTASYNDNFLVLNGVDAVCELFRFHETTLAELLELDT